MSLATPQAYIVSYDLKSGIEHYEPFFSELKNSFRWWHYLTSTWIVVSYDTQVELAGKLRPLIFQSDRLLIQPAKGPSDGWLPKDAWEWLNANLTKEW